MITEDDVMKCIEYIANSAGSLAKKQSEYEYLEAYTKSLLSTLMKEHNSIAFAGQEREARSAPQYITHLQAVRDANDAYQKERYLREAAKIKVDVWRSLNASNRNLDRIVENTNVKW